MNNPINIPIKRSYPVFEANQVLMKDHLNDLRDYLELEERITRKELIGSGIISGLRFRVDQVAGEMEIFAGTALTSDGFVIGLSKNLLCSKAIVFNNESKLKLENLPSENDQVKYYELIRADENNLMISDSSMIDVRDLLGTEGDIGIVLYLEEESIEFKSCFTTGCDDQGTRIDFTLKPILVIDKRNEVDASEVSHHDYEMLPDFNIRRLKIRPDTSVDLSMGYKSLCPDQLLIDLTDAIRKGFDLYQHLIPEYLIWKQEALAIDLIKMREKLYVSRPIFMQYFYDFIIDLIKAYAEFKQLAFELSSLNDMNHGLFPHHVVLGAIDNTNIAFHRTHFQKIVQDQFDISRQRKLNHLGRRILSLIRAFEIPSTDEEIRITPDMSRLHLLGSSAIPYYYQRVKQSQLHKYWNAEATERGKEKQILSYHNEKYNTERTDAYLNPLSYFHDDKDFLRIESHLGKPVKSVVDSILQLRQENNLAFEIVLLRLNENLGEKPARIHDEVPEFSLSDYLKKHPGLAHKGGVSKGGTFLIVFDSKKGFRNRVVADFEIPVICCGENQPEYQLDAIDDANSTLEINDVIDIAILDNDILNRNEPFEIDLIAPYVLDAVVDSRQVTTTDYVDIQVLANDQYDPDSPLEVDFFIPVDAKDINLNVTMDKSSDIRVLDQNSDEKTELDFNK